MISVDWGNTFKIFVPQSYLTIVSGTFYRMDTDQFRLDLKALEQSVEGMPHPKTHNHNTTVTIAGTQYARAVEILSPYSVEFEDDRYSVELQGSNNNIWSVADGILVQNQVQVIPTNTGGLVVSSGDSGGATPDQIATAVWNKMINDHQIEGSFGYWVGRKLLTLTKFLGLRKHD